VPDISYPASSADLRGYLALPRGTGPWPGVVVIQDAFGLSDDIREQADRLAAVGYLALAPDLYSGRGLRCVLATLQASRSGRGAAYEDIEAARRWMIEREDCTGRVGIIGFCMGGGFALLSAPGHDFAAASVDYGEVPADAVERLRGACPIVASYGGRDRALRGRAERFEQALTKLEIPHDREGVPGRRTQLPQPDQRGSASRLAAARDRVRPSPPIGRRRMAANTDLLRARRRWPRRDVIASAPQAGRHDRDCCGVTGGGRCAPLLRQERASA
jgi:carboxymethylenebutenolidase